MKKLSLLITATFLLNACSFSDSTKEEVASRPSDELEFAVDIFDDKAPSDIVVEEQKIAEAKLPDEVQPVQKDEMAGSMPEEVVEVKPEEMKIAKPIAKQEEGMAEALFTPEEPSFQDFQKAPVAAPESSVAIVPVQKNPSLGAEEKYHVQKGDTLMLIAFKIYGDYRKWRDLKEWNRDQLPKKMGPGVVLKYYVPAEAFGWQPSGTPYMVKTGDTLGLISMDKYGTSKKWKSIYDNNRPLIRDPNLIFAGFTIYYLPIRNVASENR